MSTTSDDNTLDPYIRSTSSGDAFPSLDEFSDMELLDLEERLKEEIERRRHLRYQFLIRTGGIQDLQSATKSKTSTVKLSSKGCDVLFTLSKGAPNQKIKDCFKEYGTVRSVQQKENRVTVSFQNVTEARKAVADADVIHEQLAEYL